MSSLSYHCGSLLYGKLLLDELLDRLLELELLLELLDRLELELELELLEGSNLAIGPL